MRDLEKNELVYEVGLVFILLWDIFQAVAVRSNGILLFFSLMTLAITTVGTYATLADNDNIRKFWMLFYIIPAGLLAFGAAQGWVELQNGFLSKYGLETFQSPLQGASKDYTAAFYSHYLSMCAPVASWLAAYLVPLVCGLYRKARAY